MDDHVGLGLEAMEAMTKTSQPSVVTPPDVASRIRKDDYVRFLPHGDRVVGLRRRLLLRISALIEELNQVFDKAYGRYGKLDIDLNDVHAPTDASSGESGRQSRRLGRR